jgi:hypothetical protein
MSTLREEGPVVEDPSRRVVSPWIDEDVRLSARGDGAADLRATLETVQAAAPPEDLELQQHVLSQLSPRPRWLRVLSVAPVAVSSGVVVAGLAVLGGVPGLAAPAPAGEVSALVGVVHVLSEAGVVLMDVQRAAAHLVPGGGHLVAFGVAVGGALALAHLRRRRVLQ